MNEGQKEEEEQKFASGWLAAGPNIKAVAVVSDLYLYIL